MTNPVRAGILRIITMLIGVPIVKAKVPGLGLYVWLAAWILNFLIILLFPSTQ